MVIDCHVHCRDEEWAEKETIEHALSVAQRAGVDGVFAMPNTKPHLTSESIVRNYLSRADKVGGKVFFGVYMGLTKDVEQVRGAVRVYRELSPGVVGFKIYAGRSTNPEISITDNEDLERVFDVLTREGYDGVVAVHAEKESEMHGWLFDCNNPLTHATLARPPSAEIESISDILRITEETDYKGKLDIKHISTPEGVELVAVAREKGRDVWCWVCPHHLMCDYRIMGGENGWIWKMNPPLRAPGNPERMIELLREGKIQGVETDHAPHTRGDKEPPTCASGITALNAWPMFLEFFRRRRFSEKEIERITHEVVVERHGVDIDNSGRKGNYFPNEYKTNPWRPLEEQLGFGER